MEESGRGHREKIPSAKLKETAGPKPTTDNQHQQHQPHDQRLRVTVPTYIAHHDARFEQEQREISKQYDHTKVGADGERVDFYTLGNHVESRDKRYYIRARRDPDSLYFHAAEAPPCYARLSDEAHPQCATDHANNCFTKDMRGKTGEMGSYTTRANVFAREGKFFYETRIVAIAAPGREPPGQALAQLQNSSRTATNRGGLRVGFCRREHPNSEPLGSNAYGYGVQLRTAAAASYGSVRFNSLMYKVKGGPGGDDVEDLAPGDVVGLMITLPPLEVHKKVVEGTFRPDDYPHLKCGPAKPRAKGKSGKTNKKGTSTTASAGGGGRGKEHRDGESEKKTTSAARSGATAAALRMGLKPLTDADGRPVSSLPTDHDIIRDRNPFLHKNSLVYFECPEYTMHADLQRPSQNSKQKSISPETNTKYDLESDPHPCHELPHLRTLPGSKIEIWVNGKYKGILWEHLFAFLPPASFIEKSSKANSYGEVDDGLLGYYPALTHYTGGAFECKFDGPWWHGYQDGPGLETEYVNHTRPIGHRYNEQIVEDVVADIVDEVCLERAHRDTQWMRKEVLKAGAPVSSSTRD